MKEGGTFKGRNYIDLVPGHYPTEASAQDYVDNVDKPPQPASFPASLPHAHDPDRCFSCSRCAARNGCRKP